MMQFRNHSYGRRRSAKGRLPNAFAALTEDQRAGLEHIDIDLPTIRWIADLGGATSIATTEAVEASAVKREISPRAHRQPAWRMIQTWKRLSQLGFMPTSQRNLAATRRRMHRREAPQ